MVQSTRSGQKEGKLRGGRWDKITGKKFFGIAAFAPIVGLQIGEGREITSNGTFRIKVMQPQNSLMINYANVHPSF